MADKKNSLKKNIDSNTYELAHPWRICPLGKYWVRAHSRNRVSPKGKPYTNDMKDPNLSVCAGTRWLFRKKQILEARLKRPVSWRDTVAEYKAISPDEKILMPKFDEYYRKLKGAK